jgi:hypothetical protein
LHSQRSGIFIHSRATREAGKRPPQLVASSVCPRPFFQTRHEDAGILTLFFFPVWCLLVVLGLLIGRRLGLLVTGGKRVAQR